MKKHLLNLFWKVTAGLIISTMSLSCAKTVQNNENKFTQNKIKAEIIGGEISTSEFQKNNGLVGLKINRVKNYGQTLSSICTGT